LQTNGVRIAADSRADILVVDPTAENLPEVSAWRAEHPHGRLVLFGPADLQHTPWAELDSIPVENPQDFECVRAALHRAIAEH
jgi:hypothetical protein